MKFKELYNKARQEKKFDLDEEMVWSKIEQGLGQPKKKRRFFWIWGSLCLLVIYALIYSVNDNAYPSNQITERINQQIHPLN